MPVAASRTIRSPLPPSRSRWGHSKLVLAVGLADDEVIWEEEGSALSEASRSETFVSVGVGVTDSDELEDGRSPRSPCQRHSDCSVLPIVGEELLDDGLPVAQQLPRRMRCFEVAGHFIRADAGTAIPRHDMNQLHWQLSDEPLDEGIVVARAPNFFRVCFADRIPEETVAAKVNLSRLETGPTWRDFLRFSVEHSQDGRRSMDSMLECPCCLCILRRPVALPCGHSLCRVCLMRLPFTPSHIRRCPLCRATIPHIHLSVNETLDAVTEALRACQRVQEKFQGRLDNASEDNRSLYSF